MKNVDTAEKQPLDKKTPKYIQRMHTANQKAPLPEETIEKNYQHTDNTGNVIYNQPSVEFIRQFLSNTDEKKPTLVKPVPPSH